MNRHYIGHVAIAALGFLLGAVSAMSIAPGDALLLMGTGIVFGFSARALFDHTPGAIGFGLLTDRLAGRLWERNQAQAIASRPWCANDPKARTASR